MMIAKEEEAKKGCSIIKSVPRMAMAAFAPDAPYLAVCTKASAAEDQDAFLNNYHNMSLAKVEIFKLDLDEEELPLVAACPTGWKRFDRLSWGRTPSPSFSSECSVEEHFSLGLLAASRRDGIIIVWNPLKLIAAAAAAGSPDVDDDGIQLLCGHGKPVRGLEFCSLSPQLLASGSDSGEVCVWDVEYPRLPNTTFKTYAPVSFVSWSPKRQHLIASAQDNGIAFWDVRQHKQVLRSSDSTRYPVLQWNPDDDWCLIVASNDGNSSSIRLWDVRRSFSPTREFKGHDKGVTAMSWCPNDSSYLLTCAKDNRTICWDTTTCEVVCELPVSSGCHFDVHWCPKIPGVISASSDDAKVGIYSMEACSKVTVMEGGFRTPVRLRAPKWLKCPVGALFDFGGKLISYRPCTSTQGAPPSGSEVYIHNLVTEPCLVSQPTEFEAAKQDGDKETLRALCDRKYVESENRSEDNKEIWDSLKVMLEDDGTARTKLLAHLDFTVPNEGSEADKLTDEVTKHILDQRTANETTEISDKEGSVFDIDNGDDSLSCSKNQELCFSKLEIN